MTEPRRTIPEIDGGLSPSLICAVQSGGNAEIDELSRKMLSWSHVWFGVSGSCAPGEEHLLVRQRLLSWLERCIGRNARRILAVRVEDISLASSAPLLTAFLGRRAMRELSRRVLNDL